MPTWAESDATTCDKSVLTESCVHHVIISLQSFGTGICGRKPSCVGSLHQLDTQHDSCPSLPAWLDMEDAVAHFLTSTRHAAPRATSTNGSMCQAAAVKSSETARNESLGLGLAVCEGLLTPNRLTQLQENLVPLQTELTTLSHAGRFLELETCCTGAFGFS